MTREQFDLAFKRFSRCMKDNGYYKTIMVYLFPDGRTKNDLLDEINSEIYPSTTFARLLGYINLLGPSYKKYGQSHWEEYIKTPHCLWVKCCQDNYPEYTNKL